MDDSDLIQLLKTQLATKDQEILDLKKQKANLIAKLVQKATITQQDADIIEGKV